MAILDYSGTLNRGVSGAGQIALGTMGQLQGLRAGEQNIQIQAQQQQAMQEQQQAQQQAAQQEQQTRQEGVKLLKENDPEAIAAYGIMNPEIMKDFIAAANFKDKTAQGSRIEYAQDVLSGNKDPRTAINERISEVMAAGGDPQGLIRTSQGTDEDIIAAAEKDFAVMNPGGYKAYKSALGGEKGTFTVKETPTGYIRLNTATGQVQEIPSDSKAAKKAKADEKVEFDKQLKQSDTNFQRSKDIRNRYDKQSIDFVKVRDAYARVDASASDADAAGDLSLIFNFMKMLDPGSTVREGEFATAAGAASVPERMKGAYNKVVSGEKLTTNQRKQFVDRSEKLMKAAESHNKKDRANAISLGKQWGVTENQIFGAPTEQLSDADLLQKYGG